MKKMKLMTVLFTVLGAVVESHGMQLDKLFTEEVAYETLVLSSSNPYAYCGRKDIKHLVIPSSIDFIAEGEFLGCS